MLLIFNDYVIVPIDKPVHNGPNSNADNGAEFV